MSKPLLTFFRQFPGFQYSPNAHPSTSLKQLLGEKKVWKKVYEEKKTLREAYRDALTLEFNGLLERRYMIWLRGSVSADALVWRCHPLSRNVGRYAIESLIKNNICDSELMSICFKLIRGTHVNLVDLVNGERNNGKVQMFPTVQKLSDYTVEEEKTFPRKNIHAGDLLKYLLRHIANPSWDDRRGKGRKGRARARGGSRTKQ